MKCPFQTITTERMIPGDGTLKETKVVFAECIKFECPCYTCHRSIVTGYEDEYCGRIK